jgi:hypothetical protein
VGGLANWVMNSLVVLTTWTSMVANGDAWLQSRHCSSFNVEYNDDYLCIGYIYLLYLKSDPTKPSCFIRAIYYLFLLAWFILIT